MIGWHLQYDKEEIVCIDDDITFAIVIATQMYLQHQLRIMKTFVRNCFNLNK